jgi:uncharacterized membrane protein YqaE (UPF0057 family)
MPDPAAKPWLVRIQDGVPEGVGLEVHTMLTLLAILCPPLAVLLVGRPSQAAANVGLTLLLFVPGARHALAVVDQYETARRNATLLRLIVRCH